MVKKVKPWGEGQGDSVMIDDDQFDPEFHVEIKEPKAKKPAAPATTDPNPPQQ